MPKINLLYVITKLELGGAQKQLLSLISGLDKQTYKIFLFTAKDGRLISEASLVDGLTLEKSRFLERAVNPLKDIIALIQVYLFIKKNKIQLVHTHSSKAGILGRLAAKLAGVAVIIHTVHGWSFNDYQPAVIRCLYVFLEKICANFTSKIIVVSQYDREKGLKKSIGVKGGYALIRYGLDIPVFKDAGKHHEIKQLTGLASADLAVGMIACFKSQKAPLDFIELAAKTIKKNPNAKFVLVGDGRLRKRIQARIEKLNLSDRVILTGWSNNIPFIFAELDIFVLTSLWEGLPIVVLEAMAAGVPLVATDTGGIGEVVVNGKNGYLVKPRDIPVMQERLGELLNSVQRRDEFVRRSKEVIAGEEFLLSQMVKSTMQLYSNLLSEGK